MTTRGDRLAEIVRELRDVRNSLECDYFDEDDPEIRALDRVLAFLAAHDSAPPGERVRLAVWRDEKGHVDALHEYDPNDSLWDDCPPPLCYVTFTLPPKVQPAEVEGECE
jgi:hypothetical protein